MLGTYGKDTQIHYANTRRTSNRRLKRDPLSSSRINSGLHGTVSVHNIWKKKIEKSSFHFISKLLLGSRDFRIDLGLKTSLLTVPKHKTHRHSLHRTTRTEAQVRGYHARTRAEGSHRDWFRIQHRQDGQTGNEARFFQSRHHHFVRHLGRWLSTSSTTSTYSVGST